MSTTSAIRVAVPGGSYDVIVEPGLLDRVGAVVRERTAAKRCAVVTDTTVEALFAPRVNASLRSAGIEPDVFAVPPGEGSKDWHRAGVLLEQFAEAGLGRDAIAVALGGGVVGDLAGFCAATYLRGIPVVQVPTTLLGQTDSAIGGKTAVDLRHGKNLAGAFWQPLVVISDPACLASLPESEWRSGLAEVVKSAALASEEAFAGLEADAKGLAGRDPAATERAVRMCAGFKSAVVSGDEREAADRESLNYGHTFGHALEFATGYGSIAHGIAVAEGVRFAAHLAESAIGASPAWTRRQEALLDAVGLASLSAPCDGETILLAMRLDKKVREHRIRFVLTTAPGEWRVVPIEEDVLAGELDGWCQSTTRGKAG